MDRLRLSLEIQVIEAKSIHMLREIGAQLSDSLRFKRIALLVEIMENARQFKDVVENQRVGHQVIVLDALALLIAAIGGQGAIISKGQPLHEPIARLTLVGCRLDGMTLYDVTSVDNRGLMFPYEPAAGRTTPGSA